MTSSAPPYGGILFGSEPIAIAFSVPGCCPTRRMDALPTMFSEVDDNPIGRSVFDVERRKPGGFVRVITARSQSEAERQRFKKEVR